MGYRQLRKDNDFGIIYTNGKDFCYEECSHESLLPVTDKKKINELEKILKQRKLRNNKLNSNKTE